MANTLTVRRSDPQTLAPIEMAKFVLGRDGKITSTFQDKKFKDEILRLGIRVGPRTFRLADGPAFMAALEKSFSRSTYFDVVRS